jgi:hypothetical protein
MIDVARFTIEELWRLNRARVVRLTDLPEYVAWRNMRQRCKSFHRVYYPYYRGRGITVAPEFEGFWTFLYHVGRKPSPWHSLDRINGNGDYEYFNVRWATSTGQAENRRPRRAA